MADDWKIAKLEDLAAPGDYGFVDGPFGSNLPASSYISIGIPVIRGSNLSLGDRRFNDSDFVYVSEDTADRLRRSCCSPVDIVFTKKGTIGQTGLIPLNGRFERYLLSSNQMKLTVDRSIADPTYVYYYVSSPAGRAKIQRDSEATGVPKTNLSYLRTFPILLPPLAEQMAIGEILSSLDDKIDLNRQMNETLETMARAIFKSWFLDFDPVRAKMEGRQPAGMAPETASLFPESFEESDFGEIPLGWKSCHVGDVADVNGWTLGGKDALEHVRYIEISEVMRGEIFSIAEYTRGSEPSRARRRLRHGDTVLSTVRPDRGAYFLCLRRCAKITSATWMMTMGPNGVVPIGCDRAGARDYAAFLGFFFLEPS